ncbi:MAG: GvpL/GvpF family gas vesicle protein [Oscillochloris sp.]|nr:GvpL/GvpF family gas vesicle protein [Oscillochloris sp.]
MQTIVQESQALAYYVYGVVLGQNIAAPAVPAIEPDAPVLCVGEGELTALVTPLPLDRFDPDLLEERLSDLEWLEPRARAHQAVLASVAAPVAPLRFGTIFRDEEGVRSMLRTNRALFRTALDRLVGRREWGLKIYADPKRVADYVCGASEHVRSMIIQRSRMSSGAAYLIQKKLDMRILDESRKLTERSLCEIQTRLSTSIVASAGGAVSRRSEEGPELIFSVAYLIDEVRFTKFAAELDVIVERYPWLGFELSGPWPAYSFATTPAQESGDV